MTYQNVSKRDQALGTGYRQATFSAAAGASNVCEVTVQVKDKGAVALPGHHNLILKLADAASGVGLTGTSASGTVQAKSSSGTVIGTLTSKKALLVETLPNGSFILEITDSSKTGFYVVAEFMDQPLDKFVSDVLETADYGA